MGDDDSPTWSAGARPGAWTAHRAAVYAHGMRSGALVLGLVLGCHGGGAQSSTVASDTASDGTSSGTSSGAGSSSASSGEPTTGGATGSTGVEVKCEGRTLGAGDYDEMFTEPFPTGGTRERMVRIHVPASYSPDTPTRVVVVFHGYFQDATQIRLLSAMDAASEAFGFIAVYPAGFDDTWNAGGCCGFSSSLEADDLVFVHDILDRLESEFCVDPRRIHATGLTNGGMFAQRVACEMSERIASVGSVEGGLAFDACAPARPVAVMLVDSEPGDAFETYAHSVAETADLWAKFDGCTGAATSVYEQGSAHCDERTTCEGGAAVRMCTIDAGTQPWPGGDGADLDATAALIEFFAAHPLP